MGVASSLTLLDNLRRKSFDHIEKFETYIKNNKNQYIRNKLNRPSRTSSLEAPKKATKETESDQQALEHLVHHIFNPFSEPTSQEFIDEMLEVMELSSIKTINGGTVLDFM